MEKEEILYNAIEDDWFSCSADKEDAISYVLADYDDNQISEMKKVTIYKGVKKKQDISDFLNVDKLLEDINDAACEYCGEVAEVDVNTDPYDDYELLTPCYTVYASIKNEDITQTLEYRQQEKLVQHYLDEVLQFKDRIDKKFKQGDVKV